jgi:uncharacterized protein YjdB
LYVLRANGYDAQNRILATSVIQIKVQRPDSPTSLSVWPTNPELDLGDTIFLHVTGTYGDGSTADLSQAPSTTYVSNNTAIITVSQYGQVTGVAPGSTTIVINGTLQVPVTVAPR